MDYEEIIGIAAGVLTSVSQLPQLFKTVKQKDAKSLSVGMLVVLTAGIGLWVYYGVMKKDMPIIVTNSFSELVNIILLFVCIKYKAKE